MVGQGFVGDAAVSGGGVHVLVLAGDGPRFLPCRKFVLRLCFAFGLPARLGRLAFQTVCPTVWLPVFERCTSTSGAPENVGPLAVAVHSMANLQVWQKSSGCIWFHPHQVEMKHCQNGLSMICHTILRPSTP